MHRFFIFLYYLISKNKILSVLTAMGIAVLCIFFASKINFEEDINQIIPKNEKSDLTAKVLKQLNFSDKIIVIIENKSGEDSFQLSETADTFLKKIEPLQKYISSIQGKVNDNEISETFDFVNQNLPLFLNENDYKEINQKLQKDSIAKQVEDNYISLVSPTSLVTKEFIKKDPLGLTFLGIKKLNALNISKDFKLEDSYIVTKDGKNLLLFIDPKNKSNDTKANEAFVDQLNSIKDSINKQFKGKTEISYFGSPVIAVANAKQIKKDIQNTVVISMTVLLILLIYYFRNFFTPIIVFLPTVFSVLLALLVLYFIKDKISAISLSVGAILIGITIDYALHILTHYKHNNNIEELYKEITQPIILSSATTAVSFLCLVFVRSEALKDLGLFAAITVILSSITALIIVPQLYKPKEKGEHLNTNFIDKIGSYPYEKNKPLIIGCSIIILACLFGFRHVGFNEDIGDLNYIPKELKISEAKLQKLSDITSKSIYTISYGNSEEDALSRNSELSSFLEKEKKEGKILSYNSIGSVVLSEKDQQKKIDEWNSFWNEKKKSQTISELISNGNKLGFNSSAFDNFIEVLHKDYSVLQLKDYQQVKALQISEFMSSENGFYTVSNVVKVDEKKRDAFIKDIEKKHDAIAIDRQQMNENFLGLLKRDFNTLINYSLLAIILTIIVFFRNFELTVLTMFPIVLTGVVTAGILYFLGLELNIFSTVVCTLVFGVGDDFSIFLTQAMQKEHTTGKNELPTYRISIILAVFTTILSIGSLIFAKHPALHSLALVALIGMFSVIIITSTLYPFWFRLLITNRAKKGLSPITFRLFIWSVFSFLYYGIGGLLFSAFGSFFVKNSKGNTLNIIKIILARFLTSVLYSNPFVKKKVIKNPSEDFSKPAVIIANHTSFLDTLAIAMTTHKIIYLVNDWVYQSPIFGKLVRALGFYPVSQGIENGMEKLKEKVEQGYSLVVFPEAERSYNNDIKRFHKGAFYLAEQFGLDILPIYIHGNSEVLPKGDFIIYDGSITVKVGSRISKDDMSFGKNYSERTKKINAYFREEFAKLREEIEDENYFKKKLFLSYLYKDSEVVKDVKEDFNTNKSVYFELNKHIPNDAGILHIADDFGQKDALLTLYQANRRIFSMIRNDEKRETAAHSYLVKRRKIHYIKDLSEINKKIDVLLLSDEHFTMNDLQELPETIIFVNTKNTRFESENYTLKFSSEFIKVFKST
ncbi:2-acyl-glycerophospho-ethanolamine acyltransferase [Chryseobacterium gleum]|uniref:2-acyl-glycerophospho-ethanolamine acyltransferase n=2 Tax=Chryseobacterium gleum TaxID=250 RepID=A0A448B494_CHRGE|nr:MMPL family transporter [Chryseobacterium gleum]EFK37139.1 Acyltransferase [Chryseobacterium gleum ATCC 35910]QQY33337.1 MMPL family transporter [Chryseobacterium gleum]VEE08958.1 2-acyl-glycerophospho-ethanolamine acyltransferase [Chryseobacterium gleum]